jgi:hypothetical protein
MLDYVSQTYGIRAELISYGAPILNLTADQVNERLAEDPRTAMLRCGEYHLAVARWEAENHVDSIVRAHQQAQVKSPLVVVGASAFAGPYERAIRQAAGPTTRLIGAIWSQPLLDALYAGARTYIHGHSVGGTNPSLLRAMGAARPISAFDVVFNRATFSGSAFWNDEASLAAHLVADEANLARAQARGVAARVRAMDFDWDAVAASYERLLERVGVHG